MKKRLIAFLCCSLALTFAINFRNSIQAKALSQEDLPTEVDELVYDAGKSSVYGAKTIQISTSDAPSGFTGKVMHLSGGGIADTSGIGLFLDFSSFKIPTSEIESIVFVAYSAGVEWRVSKSGAWIMRVSNSSKKWNTITLSNNQNFQAGKSFESLSSGGYLSSFEFCTNHTQEMYIDSITVNIKDHSKDELLEEMPLCNPVSGISSMIATSEVCLTNEKAKLTNVPEGYEGAVLKLSGYDSNGYMGATFDYTNQSILTTRIDTIKFRVYVAASTTVKFYITNDAGQNWIATISISDTDLNKWIDVCISSSGQGFNSGKSMTNLGNTNGYLSIFNFGVKSETKGDDIIYIDSISIDSAVIDYSSEFPITNFVEGVGAYPTDLPVYYLDSETSLFGVPTGSTDGVLKVTSTSSNMGVMFDFRAQHIKTYAIKSMTIRFYLVKTGKETASYPEARITNCAGQGSNAWAVRYLMGYNHLDEWVDLTIDNNGTNFYSPLGFGYFKDENNDLGLFEFSIRNTAVTTLYIDSVTFEFRDPDTGKPTIDYDGPTEITLPYGRPFSIEATTYDAYQDGPVPLYYEFEDGALDESGNIKEGTWICNVVARDDAGNSTSIEFTITILAPDVEAPVIHTNLRTIRCRVGAIPQLNVEVTDNVDIVSPVYIWSEGALDNYGRLTQGTHTVTISATDLSNNVATIEIQFIVE